jgi:uncharacterized ferritin-like protein (DUF455 family)
MDAPMTGTLERWAWELVHARDLEAKLEPGAPPRTLEAGAPVRRLERPGRPPQLTIVARAPKTPGIDAIRTPSRRAQLVHSFLHHELQAAELMAWAILAFPDTPPSFRTGLAAIARDELRHVGMYRGLLRGLGHDVGDFPVRDWFWERIPRAPSPASFVASLGIGFEGANLDHAARFAARFRAIGDEEGAQIQEQVAEEEIPHVRFALHWFRVFLAEESGAQDAASPRFAAWVARLVPPLSPIVMRGAPIARDARRRAGLDDAFIDELVRWVDRTPGS